MLAMSENLLDDHDPLSASSYPPANRLRGLRVNLLILCVIFVLLFTAYSGLQNLESSLNPNIGVYSLASITGGGLVSSILAPTVIRFIGAKWTIATGALCLGGFIAANFIPETPVLIPASILFGLSSGCLLTAQGTFVTTIAIEYASLVGASVETIISRFFGLFTMAFQSTQIWGNLLSSLILQKHGGSQKVTALEVNSTSIKCGAAFCPNVLTPGNTSTALPINKSPESILHILLFVYLGLAISGFFLTAFSLKPIRLSMRDTRTDNIVSTLLSTLKLLVMDVNMMLLVPIAIYSGLEQVVMYAQYTQAYVTCEVGVALVGYVMICFCPQAYVTCELGVAWVGYVMICFGVVNTIASPLNGVLAKYVGRPALYVFGFVVQTGVLIILRLWHPDKDQLVVFFIIPGLWALGDSIWQTQVNGALVGYVFKSKQEPAFASMRMCEAFGFFTSYMFSNYMCQATKLYAVGAWLIVAVGLLLVVEVRVRTWGGAVITVVDEDD